jgi:replicative DNA helicase
MDSGATSERRKTARDAASGAARRGAFPASVNTQANSSDRIPPHNLDAEQGLLASILLEGGELLGMCIEEKLHPDNFFSLPHRLIYEAMLALHTENKPVEEISLCEILRASGNLETVGGPAYLDELGRRIQVSTGFESWLEIVRAKYFRRKIIRTAAESTEKAYAGEDTVQQLLESVEKSFFEISQDQINGDTLRHIEGPVTEAVDMIETLSKQRGVITGVPTGFPDLDRMCFGFHPGQMIVVAARPGMGKTSIALNFIEAALFPKHGEPTQVLLFSLEMPSRELAIRLLCCRAGVELTKVRDGFAGKEGLEKIVNTAGEYKSLPLHIDDQGGQTILEIRAKARRLVSNSRKNSKDGKGIGLIIIDYLQLINGTDSRVPREQQIAEASRSIKAMAKEFKLPVIALAQLNRKSEDENRAPRMSDLRESGSIEQDADMVLLIDKKRKAAKRKIGKGSSGGEDEPEEEIIDPITKSYPRLLIIAKQRNGPTGEIELNFNPGLTKFTSAATAAPGFSNASFHSKTVATPL